MTTSHLIGLTAFGTLALFGILSWVLSRKHPAITADPVMARRARRAGVLLPVLGILAGYGAFAIDNRVAVVTLYEVMADGSVGLAPGTRAPLRSLHFNVEHPGVEHQLLVAPVSQRFHTPTSPVDVSFSLHGPAGEELLPGRTERFAVESRSRRKSEWEGKTFDFTPLTPGQHILRVIPLTVGIAGIHVRVADPLKRDGKRMPGY